MRIRRKYLFYTLAFTSAIIGAVMATVDAIISTNFITDPWSLGLACFLIGVPISVGLTCIFSIPIGPKSLGARFIDPSFHRIRLLTKQEVKYHILAGIGNSTLTIGYFFVLSIFDDPSVVLPFSQVAILYLLIVESVSEKNIPTLTEVQSTLIVTFGAILGSLSLQGSLSVEALVIVFLVVNPGWVLFTTYQRKLKLIKINEKPNDSLNIRTWNVLFSCLFSLVFIMIFDAINGTSYLTSAVDAAIQYKEWVGTTMFLTFFTYVFYIRALGIGKASITQAVRASTIIFVIPFTLLVSYMGLITPFSTDPTLLIMKIIGITLMILGILSTAFTLVKAYIFITIKPGYSTEETIQKLWNIHGVSRVVATAGPYDMIVKIHTRTLVKGYEKIIKKIEEIEAIDDFKWQSVLKEWEDI